ncbi:MAG: sel1 repeat family protein [Oscillospiraceae bacterium]|nr:sel1 repeat family protein [Oscillospiraceae bacterium]
MGLFDFTGKGKRRKEIDKIIEDSKGYLQQGAHYYAFVALKDIVFGKGMTKNLKKALEWYEMAANQGDEKAQEQCGYMYLKGQSTKINLDQAKYWFRKASDSSDPKVSAKAKETLKTFDILFKDK